MTEQQPSLTRTNNRFILTGNSTYVPWLECLENKIYINDWVEEEEVDGTIITKYPDEVNTGTAAQKAVLKEKTRVFKTFIFDTIDAGKIHVTLKNSIRVILEELAQKYGGINVDASHFKIKLPGKMYFDPLKNPISVFRWLHNQCSMLKSAGNPLSDGEFKACVEIGLEPPESNSSSNTYFWFNIYAKIKEKSSILPHELEEQVVKFWKTFQSPLIVNREHLNTEAMEPILPNQAINVRATANTVISKFCKRCHDNGREKVSKSHNNDKCFFKDFQGNGFPQKKGKHSANVATAAPSINVSQSEFYALVAKVNELVNKGSSIYFHDTGATPTSFVNQKPSDFVPLEGNVGTAGANSHESLGHGTIQFGDLKLTATYVPSFSKNLVSGIAINNSGYHQTIGSDLLVVTKGPPNVDATVVATGKLNKKVGLFQMDHRINGSALPLLLTNKYSALAESESEPVEPLEPSNVLSQASCPVENSRNQNISSWMAIHRSLGHCSDQIMRKTLPHVNIPKKEICKCCMEGKATRNHIPQGSRPRQILETISLDIQGPFRIKNDEGSNLNVKFVDKASRYIKMEWLPDKEGRTITTSFKGFKERMERRTGKKIQAIQTDNDPSFEGPLQDYLFETGITREKGEPYEHHFPPDAENANRLILHRSRAIHHDSNLPANFYTDAQDCAVYTHNRIIHSGQSITPFEQIYGYAPDLKLLKIHFGCVGYMFVAKEVRNKEDKLGKIEPSAKRVRCLMYGDDDSLEEIKGYKVLVEMDMSTVYTKNVKWLPDEPMAPLTNYRRITDEEIMDIYEEDNDSSGDYTEETAPDENTNDEEETALIPELGEETEESDTNFVEESNANFVNNFIQAYGHIAFALLATTDGVPQNYIEAIKSNEKDKWKESMKVEYNKFQREKVYELCNAPSTVKNVMKNRWVFKKKLDFNGNVVEYKSRLVAKGFTQKYGIDYLETYAPVAKLKSIRALTAFCAANNLTMLQDDVPCAFLQADYHSGIPDDENSGWMEQPEGFSDGTSRKCRLLKCIYGMKQSPREFNLVVHNFLTGEGFVQSEADSCIYLRISGEEILVVAVYVDDIISAGRGQSLESFRKKLQNKFNIEPSSGGLLQWYLGLRFASNKKGISIDQNLYIKQKLEKFTNHIGPLNLKCSAPLPANVASILEDAVDSNETESNFPYRQMVGSLMYAMIGTRFDICYAVSVVSQFLENPKRVHCDLVRHIYRYLRSCPDLKLNYIRNNELKLEGYVDASYANNFQYSSTSGYVMTFGGSAISWNSKRQPTIALSAAEAEYIAATDVGKECLWWKTFLKPFKLAQETITIHEDNQAAIALTKNPQFHDRTKHIQVRYHWIREQVSNGQFKLVYINTKNQLADLFTKALQGFVLRPLYRRLGLDC